MKQRSKILQQRWVNMEQGTATAEHHKTTRPMVPGEAPQMAFLG